MIIQTWCEYRFFIGFNSNIGFILLNIGIVCVHMCVCVCPLLSYNVAKNLLARAEHSLCGNALGNKN